jgi:acyl dehydratase
MPLDYEAVMTWPFAPVEQLYTVRDTILYALSVGAGSDPADDAALRFVYEERLEALPTMALVLGWPGLWLQDPRTGVDWRRMVHGEQRLVMHAALPVAGTVVATTRVESVVDKGPGRGALIHTARELYDGADGTHLASQLSTSFCRSDGGFGGPGGPVREPHVLPNREADARLDVPTLPQQARLYRLNGDLNPLHVDPVAAAAAGFDRPILHGLCTFGAAGYALLSALCGSNPLRLRALEGRFSRPVFPGDMISVAVWHEGTGRAGFRARVPERDVCVIDNGLCEFDAEG